MTIVEALRTIERDDQDLFALLQSIYAEQYSGMVILHCVHGVPRKAEFPSTQVTLTPRSTSALDKQGRCP